MATTFVGIGNAEIQLVNAVLRMAQGQFISVHTSTSAEDMDKKQLKRKSPYLGRLTKTNIYKAVRFCNYEEMQATKEKRAEGIEAVAPSWWEWVKFPYIAKHKTNGQLYVVVKPTTVIPSADYMIDGRKVAKSEIQEYLRKESDEEPQVYMLKLQSITHIKQGSIEWGREVL